MKILVIDNYDSFTYNLVQLVGSFTPDVVVKRNDRTTIAEIERLAPDRIVISPGPGRPEDAAISIDVVERLGERVPILGVCLGLQTIASVAGATVANAPALMHGKTSTVEHDGERVYRGVPQNFEAGRYHSLVVDATTLPDRLVATAWSPDGVLMGARERERPVEGVQFHPESILTPVGRQLIKNWIDQV
jgi:anthranilate synthase/aminodeoxychorismate synthase-like glutamine amidotransferase